MSQAAAVPAAERPGAYEKQLFWACFLALIATAFGFVVRGQVINEWGTEFGLSETQKGEIFGAGLYPFAISIVLFSLIIDKIGYGKAMVFAFVCHVASAIITIFATGYWSLYLGTFIVALGNGTVEAVINPVVATLFKREKTKWLNILHAGWPGGLVLGGIIAIAMGDINWKYKVALILLPTVGYALMMLGKKFPVQERVAAGVSYKDMLKEIGGVGALIVLLLIFGELGRVFKFPEVAGLPMAVPLAVIVAVAFGAWVKALGRPMFIFLMLIMIPLATTELGTDSWITPLMETEMHKLGLHAGWVLVYTSLIMMILRFFAGPIVHTLSPLGLLAISALIAAGGLMFLSVATGMTILVAATVYGFGKTFFWPTMLGVAAERFPKGGALTLNTLGGVGMLGVGVVGGPFLGYVQDVRTVERVEAQQPSLYSELKAEEQKESVFGAYQALDGKKEGRMKFPVDLWEQKEAIVKDQPIEGEELETTLLANEKYAQTVRNAYNQLLRPENDFTEVPLDQMYAALEKDGLILDSEEEYQPLKEKVSELKTITTNVQKGTLATVAIFPIVMFVCYLGLIGYFRSKGGYQAEVLTGHAAEDEKFTGGVTGPADH